MWVWIGLLLVVCRLLVVLFAALHACYACLVVVVVCGLLLWFIIACVVWVLVFAVLGLSLLCL